MTDARCQSRYSISVLLIMALISVFGEEQKSIKKGENHYKSGNVDSFTYGEVHASMQNSLQSL